MTVVKSYRAIRYHPLIAIAPEVAELLERASAKHQEEGGSKATEITCALKLLEAFCDITGQRITLATLFTSEIEKIMRGFCSAMVGGALTEQSETTAITRCRLLYQAIASIPTLRSAIHLPSWDIALCAPDPMICSQVGAATDYQRWYWGGWSIEGTSGAVTYLRLAELARHHGHAYVDNIYEALQKYGRIKPASIRAEWNHLFDYLTKNHEMWTPTRLSTEEGVKTLMHEFTFTYFSNAKAKNNDPQSQIKNWTKFVKGIEECFCKNGIWATLTSPIRKPPASTKRGSDSKTFEDANGIIVQEKLLTKIPLYVSDSEAVELLFFHIKNDLSVVRNWATQQADDLIARYRRRKSLALLGTSIKYTGGEAYKNYSLADICATLEDTESGIAKKFLCKIHNHITGESCNQADLAHHYGYITTGSLFPHQCILVLEHPSIITEFLRDFELYNENGQLSGFDEDKRTITGYKDRKESSVREQTIDLTDISFARVRELIEITSDSRIKLKNKNDDNYRYLFLTTGRGFQKPKQAQVTIWNDSKFNNNSGLREKLISQFSPHCTLPEKELVDFLKKIRLTTIRASRAVEVFIETKSTEAMSKALGHEHYYSDLLSHYLPDALLAFIKARWIRIFQKSMVCLAMEDSPYLARATQFNNMDELDLFLDKHRIKEIPSQVSDPERIKNIPINGISEAIFSIGTAFLASLLSLEAAVKASMQLDQVCGKAVYWSSIAGKIKSEITNGKNRPLKKYLESALKLIDPKKMEKLIYVPDHWI